MEVYEWATGDRSRKKPVRLEKSLFQHVEEQKVYILEAACITLISLITSVKC